MDIDEIRDNIKQTSLMMRKFLCAPRTIGSIAPSSRVLTDAMFENVKWSEVRSVAELGAGTGVFTRQIINRMSPETKLMIFEIEDELREKLEKETGRHIHQDAAMLPYIMKNESIDKIDLIISSLPHSVLPPEVTAAVLQALPMCVASNGTFIAFQYSLQMKEPFKKIFQKVETKFVPINIPPAFVYECCGLNGCDKSALHKTA